jgi:tetratricopeptide (TPR) repeat protein
LGIMTIGRLLGRARAGLYGALLYGVTSVAIMFCTTLLKEVWVAALITWWVAGALTLIRSERAVAWLAFGAYCGIAIAFRSTLAALALVALLLPVFGGIITVNGISNRARKSALIACGLAVALAPWSLRNFNAYGSVSPLPHNGGVVLDQLYNSNNPTSTIWVPDFVNYLDPSEIWRGYSVEATKREGRTLSPAEVDGYWKRQALDYMVRNPAQVIQVVLIKIAKLFSANEIPINRSLEEESMFSPVLRWLPAPAPWLLSMGIAGLIWLAIADRRWPIVATPILVALLTFTLFWAEDRFRFHTMAVLALCSGVWIDQMTTDAAARRWRKVAIFAALAGFIGSASVYIGSKFPPAPIRWYQVAWGYIHMGKISQARSIAERISSQEPENGQIQEALGYTAIARQDYSEAASDYERAVALRPRSHIAHYNLAKVYLKLGDMKRAEEEAQIAVNLDSSPEYKILLEQIQGPQ